ncbi:L-threonate dehydrogenase [Vibrio nigripulchritudo]|uniref:L-threonate dehydrogenase n=1 Tax=Vibrio nigripulchritudo TaxID=28173 RepID=UPI00248FA5E8|nr:L-threonate dehydrogenase [Vibrio nigripulchritudo]BDU38349.1 dehydrogenase/oxidoreductase [Vibrio nigripulchritudo]BDU44071.1 dehydrogenase/oxidoreductase [Vibrio nigripulchritudo]
MTAQVSLIGLGSMGQGMARNIIGSGIALRGYDVSPDALSRFQSIGGSPCSSVSDAAEYCDLLVLMVVNAAQAEEVLFAQGAAKNMAKNGVVMLCSTVSPSDTRKIAAQLTSYNLVLLDAPVSGGKVGADSGTLTVMASGCEHAFKQADGVLNAISKKVHQLGIDPGMASTYKVVHQLAAGVHLVTAAELIALGAKAGCDVKILFDIVSTSAGNSWMFSDRVPHMLDEDFTPRSMVDIFVKDLDLVLQTGKDLQAALPLSSAAHQMLVAASGMGHGKLDDSAVVKVYEALMDHSLNSAQNSEVKS